MYFLFDEQPSNLYVLTRVVTVNRFSAFANMKGAAEAVLAETSTQQMSKL